MSRFRSLSLFVSLSFALFSYLFLNQDKQEDHRALHLQEAYKANTCCNSREIKIKYKCQIYVSSYCAKGNYLFLKQILVAILKKLKLNINVKFMFQVIVQRAISYF